MTERRKRPARVFILEDDGERLDDFQATLGRAHVTIASSYDEAIALFKPPYDILCLDHDLGSWDTVNADIENNGYEFVLWLPRASDTFRPTVFVHTSNEERGVAMGRELRGKGFTPIVQSFGSTMLEALRIQSAFRQTS